MSGLFISYRREDQPGYSGRLADAMGAAFGADNVFRDIEDIHPGEDFVIALNNQLRCADVMLVVIGPAWLTTSRNGIRRLDEPEDFVRREIQAGLESGKPVLPVLIGGAAMPAEQSLPVAIGALARRQAIILSDAGWTADVARLVNIVSPFLPARQSVFARFGRAWSVAGILLVAMLFLGLKACWPDSSTTPPPPVSAEIADKLSGRWTGQVKYDWGDEHEEIFEFALENMEVHGTASYLLLARTIEQGQFHDGRLSFITHTQESWADDSPRELTHRYRATLKSGELRFVLESSDGQSPHSPVEFVARRFEITRGH